jgi:FlaA1/EpsC-like NDP-sugar epimerase
MVGLNKVLKRLFRRTPFKKKVFFLILDTFIISFSIFASFWLRFNGSIPSEFRQVIPYFILLALLIKLGALLIFNLYDISWRFVSLEELIKIIKALVLGSVTLGMSLYVLRVVPPFDAAPFPRSALLLDFIIALFLIGASRIAKRVVLYGLKTNAKPAGNQIRVLVFGAGRAGEQIIREMITNKNSNYLPIGLADDYRGKQGISIHGIKVLGSRKDLPALMKKHEIGEILIALPGVPSREVRRIVQIIKLADFNAVIKILPSTSDLIDGKVTLSDIHEVKLEDLLGRAAVNIDYKIVQEFIKDKVILITGAGGSIGSELVKACLQFQPQHLIVFDNDETELFYLTNRLDEHITNITPVIGDIKDDNRIESMFQRYKPQVVIHSAAYKHVPIQEYYPEEAVKTNILGTKILAEAALKHEVEKFVLISSDKAINPTSVMGATKRVCEEVLKIFNSKNKTKFVSVRLGNVLGSRGSVIPLFKEQIKRGGPVTVTHPDMKRYFMITSEAVLLVMEAAALGKGGEVFVLDMGDPVKIVDLAREMIKISGFQPNKDIHIVFTNIRPGEKLFEELLTSEEGTEATKFEKIFRAKTSISVHPTKTMQQVDVLIQASYSADRELIIQMLKKIVPTYHRFETSIFKAVSN